MSERQKMAARFRAVVACALLAGCAHQTPRSLPQAPVSRVTVPPAPPPGEPADIAGLHSTQLKEIFGTPAFVRKEGKIEIWRYDGARCKAFVFLYPFGDTLLVRHVETLPRGHEMAADETCLNSFHPHQPAPVS